MPLEAVADEWLRLLCRGLLLYDRDRRWGSEEVARWLAGDLTLSVVGEPGEDKPPPPPPPPTPPYKIGERSCTTAAELAAGMREAWSLAVRDVARFKMLEQWLSHDLGDDDAARWLRDLVESAEFRGLDGDTRLGLFLPQLDPTLPPIVEGEVLTPEGFAAWAEAAAQSRKPWPAALKPGLGERLAALTGAVWLAEALKAWRIGVKAAQASEAALRWLKPDLPPLDLAADPELLLEPLAKLPR